MYDLFYFANFPQTLFDDDTERQDRNAKTKLKTKIPSSATGR